MFTVNCIEKTKIKKKRSELAHKKTQGSDNARGRMVSALDHGIDGHWFAYLTHLPEYIVWSCNPKWRIEEDEEDLCRLKWCAIMFMKYQKTETVQEGQ